MFFLGQERLDELVQGCQGAIELEFKSGAKRPRLKRRGAEAELYEFSERDDPPSGETKADRIDEYARKLKSEASGKMDRSLNVSDTVASPVAVEVSNAPVQSVFQAFSLATARKEFPPPQKSSGLASIIGAGEENDGPDEDFGGDALSLTIYLPDFSPVKVKVPKESTAEDVIDRTLRTVIKEGKRNLVESEEVASYELRMHDSDGEPEDFAIERSAQIDDLGDDEFCIYFTGHSGEPSSADAGAPVLAKGYVKVVLESDQAHTGDIRRSQHNIFKIEDDWTVCDLLLQIAKKRSAVRLLSEQMYELRLSEDDMDEHHFWSEASDEPDGVLPLHLLLSTLDVRILHLHRKKFEDEGLVKVNKAARGATGNKRSEYTSAAAEMKSDEEALNKYYLRYTEIQARQWEEWAVIKINKVGKEQRRRMGIGLDRSGRPVITNEKMDNSARFLAVSTNKRFVDTIKDVRMDPTDPNRETVEIVYQQEGDIDHALKYRPYTMQGKTREHSNEEAVRIACKLLCLKDISEQKKKRVRKLSNNRIRAMTATRSIHSPGGALI